MAKKRTHQPTKQATAASLSKNKFTGSDQPPAGQEGPVQDLPPPSSMALGGTRSGLAGSSTTSEGEARPTMQIVVDQTAPVGEGPQAASSTTIDRELSGQNEPSTTAQDPPTSAPDTGGEPSPTPSVLGSGRVALIAPPEAAAPEATSAPDETTTDAAVEPRCDEGARSSDQEDTEDVYGTEEGPGLPADALADALERSTVRMQKATISDDRTSRVSPTRAASALGDNVDVVMTSDQEERLSAASNAASDSDDDSNDDDDWDSPGIPVGIEHVPAGFRSNKAQEQDGKKDTDEDEDEDDDDDEDVNEDEDEDGGENDDNDSDDDDHYSPSEDDEAMCSSSEDENGGRKRRRAAGLSDDANDSSDDDRGTPRTTRRLKKGRIQRVTSDLSEDGDSEIDALEPNESAAQRPRRNLMGRVLRAAAEAATRNMSKNRRTWTQWESATRRRTRKRRGESKSEDDDPEEPEYTEELLEKLVDKKIEDGVVYYRAKWVEADTPEERYTWEPVEHLENQKEWMELVDLWVKKCAQLEGSAKKPTFDAFIKNNVKAILLGDSVDMKCFFFAIEAVRKLLDLQPFDVEAVVSYLEQKGWDFSRGVKKEAAIDLMEAITKAGLMLNREVWKSNTHISEYGTGPAGVCKSLGPDIEGVWMIATVDTRRVGHCWVLAVDEDGMMTVYDNGAETEFANLRFGEILWVRRCVPFVKPPKSVKNKPTRRGRKSKAAGGVERDKETAAVDAQP